jgi:hypothetical protein
MRSTWLYLAAMPPSACLLIVIFSTSSSVSIAQESAKETGPGRYFRLMEMELALIEKRLETESSNDAEFNARHYPSGSSATLRWKLDYWRQYRGQRMFVSLILIAQREMEGDWFFETLCGPVR